MSTPPRPITIKMRRRLPAGSVITKLRTRKRHRKAVRHTYEGIAPGRFKVNGELIVVDKPFEGKMVADQGDYRMPKTDEIPKRPSDTDRLMQLSLLLKALDDLDAELAEYKADYKAKRETLLKQLGQLRYEVLSGQERLPMSAD